MKSRRSFVENLERRELLNADWNPGLALKTGFFLNQEGVEQYSQWVDSFGASGSSSNSGAPEGGATSLTTVNEVEPNNNFGMAQLLPTIGAGGVNVFGRNPFNSTDVDHYAFDLNAGDILDVRLTGAANPATAWLHLYETATRTELLATQTVQTGMPTASPLTGAPNSLVALNDVALHYVVPKTTRYQVEVSDTQGNYTLQLRQYRPTLESQAAGNKQIIYLDFDGTTIPQSLFGLGTQSARISPLRNFLTAYGLQASDEAALIDKITADFQAKFDYLGQHTTNPNFGIEVLNSKDHGDLWGLPNVSRIVFGGTWQELMRDPAATNTGLVLGIAESVDPGNFALEESVIVMNDILLAGINTLNVNGSTPRIDAIAELLGYIAAHEGGHILGGWHQDANNSVNVIMDQTFSEILSSGSGVDQIFGTADDVRIQFGIDGYAADGVWENGGVNDTLSFLGWGLSTGQVGSRINGNVYLDKNLNRILDAGDSAGPLNTIVFTDINGNGVKDAGEYFDTTDAAGNFTLLVPAGTYTVRTVVPSGYRSTSAATQSIKVTGTNNVSGVNFGLEKLDSSITGVKWNDINGNGLRDVGEPTISGIWIYIDLDGDNRIDIGEPTTVTGADGSYKFSFPGAGTYTIREVAPAGYSQTFPGPAVDNEHTITLTGNASVDAFVVAGLNFGNRLTVDYGDAPITYGIAAHGYVSGLQLGPEWDAEQASQFSDAANGDDLNGADDEDGITLARPLVRGSNNNRLSVQVVNNSAGSAVLSGWADFNNDGDFLDAGEQIVKDAAVVAGTNSIVFAAPSTAVLGNIYTRFRLSQTPGLGPTGNATGGEVEDYVLTVVDSVNLAVDDLDNQVKRNSQLNSIDVLANDFRLPGETLSVVSTSGVSSAGGTVTVAGDGQSVLYTPATGFIGTDTFTYTMINSAGEQDSANVTVSVSLFFENPEALDDSFEVSTNASDIPLNVLANDIEGQAGALTIISVTQPNNGDLRIATGGKSLRYTPTRGFASTDFATYTVIDSAGNRSTAEITFHLLPGDRADDQVLFKLVATDLAGNPISSITQGESFKIDIIVDDLRSSSANITTDAGVYAAYADILFNAQLVSTTPNTDPNSPLDFTATFFNQYTQFRQGDASVPGIIQEFGAISESLALNVPDEVKFASITFKANSPGVVNFMPDPADIFPLHDTLLFNAPSTGVPLEQIRYIGTSLEIVGDGIVFPVAVDDSVAQPIPQNSIRFAIDVLANDRPGSTGTISIVSVGGGVHGTTTIFNNNTADPSDDKVLYTPTTSFNGTDQFIYTIEDGRGIRSTATVTVRVGSVEANDIVGLELVATNLDGTPIDQVAVGQQFLLRGFVQDLRTTGSNLGVFAAYEDVLYSANIVSPVADSSNGLGFQVQFGPNYQNVREGDARVAGLINEIGAVQLGNTPLGNTRQLLFSITMTANAVGVARFVADPADVKPLHDTLTFDPAAPVLPDLVRYGFDSLTVVASSGSGGGGEGFTNLSNPLDVNNDGFISPIDALGIINNLNANGSRGLGEGESGSSHLYVDVNADGAVSPIDALMVINFLNRGASGEGEGMSLQAATGSSQGDPMDDILGLLAPDIDETWRRRS